MSRITIDSTMREKLNDLVQPVELCDESGRVLGRFYPKLDPTRFKLQPQISREEMERRKNSKERTYTTAEVLAYLEKL